MSPMSDTRITTPRIDAFVRRFASVSTLGLLLGLGGVGAAFAQSCQEDFQKLSQRRNDQIAALNALGKANKGKMDPTAACPLARRLVVTEGEMLSYMEKNKDWCAIPDEAMDGFKQTKAKAQNFAAQACAAAEKAKKMQAEHAQAGGQQVQKLPAGPL